MFEHDEGLNEGLANYSNNEYAEKAEQNKVKL